LPAGARDPVDSAAVQNGEEPPGVVDREGEPGSSGRDVPDWIVPISSSCSGERPCSGRASAEV